jgi:hypothetical protein
MAKLRLPQLCTGKAWTLKVMPRVRHDGKECWGTCDPILREIRIAKATERHGVARVTILHEVGHKFMWWMDEEAIEHLATDFDDVLEVCEAAGILL